MNPEIKTRLDLVNKLLDECAELADQDQEEFRAQVIDAEFTYIPAAKKSEYTYIWGSDYEPTPGETGCWMSSSAFC